MKYTTELSDIRDGAESIRGYALGELVQHKSFAEMCFLLLRGELPTKEQGRMFDAILSVSIDHGPGTASAQTARIAASAKSELHVAVAAGILAMGARHGSAITGAAEFFKTHKDEADISALVQRLKDQKVRVPGYGHAVLSHDERSDILFGIAKETGIYGGHCAFAENFHTALNSASSKQLPINIDGSMAAVLLDMGFDPEIMKGIFVIARMPGLVAQVREEQIQDNGLRRLPQEEIEYIGTAERKL